MSQWAEERSVPVPGPGCWLWLGAGKGNGYGNVRQGGANTTAHRRSYIESFGPVPDGMFVCHRCDTRECINPDHLFLGTQADNMRDALEKGRIAHGAGLPQCKLLPRQVVEIRARVTAGHSDSEIGRAYGVDRMTIKSIRVGKTHKRSQ